VATDLLIRRARLPAIMFRFDQDPDAVQTISTLDDEMRAFASSSEYYREIIGLNHYLGPLPVAKTCGVAGLKATGGSCA
jgi:hypothetical protein